MRGLQRVVGWWGRAAHHPASGTLGRPLLESGFFATVLELGHGLGLALTTDGGGTKLLGGQMAGKYETGGIDCGAMNVNDLVCVGAEPLAMLDYIAAEKVDPEVFEQLGEGLETARRRTHADDAERRSALFRVRRLARRGSSGNVGSPFRHFFQETRF